MDVDRKFSGEGWRLGWFPNASPVHALVGSNSWIVELTALELKDFCRLSLQLADTMQQMQAELSDMEKLSCSAESDLVYLEVDGFPGAFDMRLQLLEGRRVEVLWDASAVTDLLKALREF